MKKIISTILITVLALTLLVSCSGTKNENLVGAANAAKTYKIGICNYVDDASLNQIVDNIKSQLDAEGKANNTGFEILYQNCNADTNVLNQIIADFESKKVDLMIGIATPVAMAMQAATEKSKTPVVFAAVTDPEGAQLVASNAAPGANITGTSDYLNTEAVMNLIFAQNPDAKKIALLYDVGQGSSETPIKDAKAYLDKKGVEYKEYNGTNTTEIQQIADAIVADKCDAIFTPQDNTVMAAELSIYEKFADAKIPQFTGADSFALNGAFVGYGVDYANLGRETAKMAADILINGKDVATYAVRTFDNGTATVNTDICEKLGVKYEDIKAVFEPFCTKVQSIATSESFDK